MPSPSNLTSEQRGVPVIRRQLLPILAVIIAAAVLIASAPVEAGPRKVKLGISTSEGRHSPESLATEMDKFKAETESSEYPAIWTLWSQWGNPDTKKFPADKVAVIKAKGAVPLFFWEPVKQQGLCTDHARFRKIANGKFDKYIKNWAKAAKKSNTKILLRFAHEINGGYFPWTIGNCGNKIKHYKAAWKRVYNLMRNKVGAKNVKFVWTVAKKNCKGGCNPYKPYYPGHKFVQFAGFSSFNWGNHFNRTWKEMPQGVRHVMKFFKEFTKKPVIIAELATNQYGHPTKQPDKAKHDWIVEGYQAVYDLYPRIKAIIYLHENLERVNHPDWSLNSTPGAMEAYRQLVNTIKFSGRF